MHFRKIHLPFRFTIYIETLKILVQSLQNFMKKLKKKNYTIAQFFSRICNFQRARNLAYGHEVVSWENTVTNICLHSISFYVHCLYCCYSIEPPSVIKSWEKVQFGIVALYCLPPLIINVFWNFLKGSGLWCEEKFIFAIFFHF